MNINGVAKSVPEAILHYYISQYVDENATINCVNITEDGKTFTADIACSYKEKLYDIEYDSLSFHEESEQKDIHRDGVFNNHGYTVIRMSSYTKKKPMSSLPGVANIGFPLGYISASGSFTQWEIQESNLGIEKLLLLFGIKNASISIERDYNYIIDRYFPNNNFKHIECKNKFQLNNVVFWNANGCFRKKCSVLFALDADVYIVAECENPSCYTFPDSCKNYIWTGEKKQRGLAVFAKENILIQKDDWLTGVLRCFLPFKANGRQFVGVWACKPYIEEYFVWQSLNMKNIDADTVIIGDFNSNSMWDYKHGTRNHTAVVNQLKEKGLVSAYHFTRNEAQGHEREYTFFQYRHLDKGYHIDYAFCSENMIKSMIIHNDMQWHELSDHLPLQLVFERDAAAFSYF